MKISKGSDIEQWLEDNESSLKSGVICEEILSDDNEFSFDGVAGSYWITQKFTTRGAFRAEYQHIMPAPLPKTSTEKIHSVLEPLITNLGSRGGAFHHEFFILSDGRIASVEPNRRPAGMWLWDLATLAFEDFNPWHLWIAHCAGHIKHQGRPIPKTFAGVRGVIVPEDCVLLEADSETLKALLISRFGNGFAKVSLLKKPNDLLRSIPRDNSDFVAFVALTHDNYDQLRNDLDEAAEIVISHLGVTPCVAK